MKKTKVLFIVSLATLFLTVGVCLVQKQIKPTKTAFANATSCDGHVGYHYLRKEPTETESGHKEFWTCCKCHQQFLEEQEGTFITVSDSMMSGGIDENHIAYLAPLGENIVVGNDDDDDGWGDINWF